MSTVPTCLWCHRQAWKAGLCERCYQSVQCAGETLRKQGTGLRNWSTDLAPKRQTHAFRRHTIPWIALWVVVGAVIWSLLLRWVF